MRFDDGSRALYATDGSNYRQAPIGVVDPARRRRRRRDGRGLPRVRRAVLSRGGGTSLAGQCCNVAVVMDFTKYLNDSRDRPGRDSSRASAGARLDDLRNEAEQIDLTFGPDPSTHTHCTLGGMIGNNSCGVALAMGLGTGRTSDNVHALEILTYDGARMRSGRRATRSWRGSLPAGGRGRDLRAA